MFSIYKCGLCVNLTTCIYIRPSAIKFVLRVIKGMVRYCNGMQVYTHESISDVRMCARIERLFSSTTIQ